MTLAPYLDLIRFNRPVGWLVLYWPTMISSFVAAEGWPGWHLFIVFSLGVFRPAVRAVRSMTTPIDIGMARSSAPNSAP